MNLSEALRLLGVEPGDSERAIKAKYHQEIRRFHPDCSNIDADKALAMTKQLNIAFRLVTKELHARGEDIFVYATSSRPSAARHSGSSRGGYNSGHSDRQVKWPAAVNPKAFCDRTIYASGDLFSSMDWFEDEEDDSDAVRLRPVASGKYFWDPDYESFPLFIYSIHQKCKALLQDNVVNPMLFHYLMLEFIRPVDCLQKIADDYPGIKVLSTESGSHQYQFEARLPMPGRYRYPSGQELIPTIIAERIHITLADGTDLGHLSFEEDPLYYICLMVLRTGHPDFRLCEPSVAQGRKGRSLRLMATVTVPEGYAMDAPESHNLEIAGLI